MAKVKHLYIEVAGYQIPAKVYWEYRKDIRASIGQKSAILRMPNWSDKEEQQEHYNWFVNWLEKQFQKQPDLIKRFYTKSYEDGEELTVCGKTYKLQLREARRENHYAKKLGSNILLEINHADEPANIHKSIRHLLSRIIGRDLKPMIEKRVHELNAKYFKQPIKSVNLKYNLTNWGSCSSKGNVNLSTRLLLAPAEVRDYVIIHELAHLIELNHSDRFWALVAEAMPEYKIHEEWLSKNNEKCNF